MQIFEKKTMKPSWVFDLVTKLELGTHSQNETDNQKIAPSLKAVNYQGNFRATNRHQKVFLSQINILNAQHIAKTVICFGYKHKFFFLSWQNLTGTAQTTSDHNYSSITNCCVRNYAYFDWQIKRQKLFHRQAKYEILQNTSLARPFLSNTPGDDWIQNLARILQEPSKLWILKNLFVYLW